MMQAYCTEEAMEWALNYANPSNPIGVPKSLHEGRLTDPNLFLCTHFHVLQQIIIVSEYLDEHKDMLLRDNPGCNESYS
jgi:hypothetical protein